MFSTIGPTLPTTLNTTQESGANYGADIDRLSQLSIPIDSIGIQRHVIIITRSVEI